MVKLNTMHHQVHLQQQVRKQKYLHTIQNAAAEPAFNNYKLQLSEIRKQKNCSPKSQVLKQVFVALDPEWEDLRQW